MKLYRVAITRTFYIVAADAESAEDLAALQPDNDAEKEIRVSQATEKSLKEDKWLYVDAYDGPPDVPCHALVGKDIEYPEADP